MNSRITSRILEILMKGVSTRNYKEILPEMAETVGGSKAQISINRLGLPGALRRCLGSTNVIESPNSGIRTRTRRVKNWRDHAMVVRWVAASLLDMEKRFKRIMGCQQLWMLDAKLKALAEDETIDTNARVA